MGTFRSLIKPTRTILVRHVGRLCQTLETFCERLRDAVSSALGDTVSGVVRETIRTVLGESSLRSPAAERLYSPPDSRQSWRRDEFEEDPWFDDPEGDWPGDEGDRDLADDPRTARWPNAVTLGIQAGVWYSVFPSKTIRYL